MIESTHPLATPLLYRQKTSHVSRRLLAGWQFAFGVLSATACLTSGYLAWIALTAGSVAGCGSGEVFDCSHVLTSRWSSFFGVPVGVLAVALHMSVLTLLVAPIKRSYRWPLITFAALSAGFGGLWFIGLQVFLLEHLCFYCMVVHSCGLAMAMLVIWNAPVSRSVISSLGLGGVLLVALFATGQWLMPTSESFELVEHGQTAQPTPSTGHSQSEAGAKAAPLTDEAEAEESGADAEIFESPLSSNVNVQSFNFGWPIPFSPVALLTAQVTSGAQPTDKTDDTRKFATVLSDVKLDVTAWPLLGKPDADIVIVEMLDYTCGHCQNTHAAVAGAMSKFGDRLAVIILPVPLDAACNPQITATAGEHREACQLAKLAIAVWHVKPAAFTEFHHWLMQTKPNYSQAYARAEQSVGSQPLRDEMASSIPSKFIEQNLKLYQRANGGSIPKILFPTSTAVGELRSTETLLSIIEQQLGQRP